jgi:hypothetical protein
MPEENAIKRKGQRSPSLFFARTSKRAQKKDRRGIKTNGFVILLLP